MEGTIAETFSGGVAALLALAYCFGIATGIFLCNGRDMLKIVINSRAQALGVLGAETPAPPFSRPSRITAPPFSRVQSLDTSPVIRVDSTPLSRIQSLDSEQAQSRAESTRGADTTSRRSTHSVAAFRQITPSASPTQRTHVSSASLFYAQVMRKKKERERKEKVMRREKLTCTEVKDLPRSAQSNPFFCIDRSTTF
jgi:hypothetical protein